MKNDFDTISWNSHSPQKIRDIDKIKEEAEEGKEYCNKKGWKKEAEALQNLIVDIREWQDYVEFVNSFLKLNAPEYVCRTVGGNDIWLQRTNSDDPGFLVSVNDFTENMGEKLSTFLKEKEKADEEFFKDLKGGLQSKPRKKTNNK